MGWLHAIAIGATGLAAMRAAIDRGDIDEAARQGSRAGPTVIEDALRAPDRAAKLAGIAAAPTSDDRVELLAPLAKVAATGDRRVALPAAQAAREIARDFAHVVGGAPPDDIAGDDITSWRDAFAELARDRDRWIDLRILALDTAVALDAGALDLGALADPDPAYRAATIALVPMPVPVTLRKQLAGVVTLDLDPDVALAAAAVLCADLAADPPAPILDALGPPGLDRIRSLVAANKGPRAQLKDASRCISAKRP